MGAAGSSTTADIDAVAALALDLGITIAVAESLTAGRLATALARGGRATTWFRGGVVAYQPTVKQHVLGVAPGPVVTAACADAMAHGAARLLRADVALATTGVGGPREEEGEQPGTVWLARLVDGHIATRLLHLDGDVDAVLDGTVADAMRWLREGLEQHADRRRIA